MDHRMDHRLDHRLDPLRTPLRNPIGILSCLVRMEAESNKDRPWVVEGVANSGRPMARSIRAPAPTGLPNPNPIPDHLIMDPDIDLILVLDLILDPALILDPDLDPVPNQHQTSSQPTIPKISSDAPSPSATRSAKPSQETPPHSDVSVSPTDSKRKQSSTRSANACAIPFPP